MRADRDIVSRQNYIVKLEVRLMALMNYDPWQEFTEMRRVFNRMFGDGFLGLPMEEQSTHGSLLMPVDIAETPQKSS